MAVLQNDNEQLEQEKSALKERLKQLTKTKLVDDLIQKKVGTTQKTSGLLSKHIITFPFFNKLCSSLRSCNRRWSFSPTTSIIIV